MTPVEWVFAIIVAIILGILAAWAYVSSRGGGGGGGGGGGNPTPPAWEQPRAELQELLEDASPDDCPEIRAKLQEMKDQGAPTDLTDQLKTQIDLICD